MGYEVENSVWILSKNKLYIVFRDFDSSERLKLGIFASEIYFKALAIISSLV
jgi:hypothetical protein